MENHYTKLDGIYVLPDPGDLAALKLDSCLVARRKGKLYVHSIEALAGKEVERERNQWCDPVFGYYNENGGVTEKFLILNGQRKDTKFCNLCKDRLNGITGNCFDHNLKPKGCSFDPAKNQGEFRISLGGWTELRPSDVNSHSPFKKPWSCEYVSLDPKTIRQNRKARKVRANFYSYLKKKEEKYCSRCIRQGLCYMSSRKIAEHCMVTDETTLRRCLKRITAKFGSVEEFLNRLAYSGKEIVHRPAKDKRRTKWIIVKPAGQNHFLVRKLHRPWRMTKVTKRKVEKAIVPETLPWQNREKIAAVAWFFFEKYCADNQDAYRGYRGRTIRILSVIPVENQIEVSYYPYGWRLNYSTQHLSTFNDVLRFER